MSNGRSVMSTPSNWNSLFIIHHSLLITHPTYLRFMKWIGILAAIALMTACFFPWVFIESKNITVTGINSAGTNFGKPGYFHFFLAAMYLLFTFIPRVWAKRWNLLIVALNIGWAARNYFIISACSGGECPGKKAGLYIVLISSLLMLVAALFPKMELSSGHAST